MSVMKDKSIEQKEQTQPAYSPRLITVELEDFNNEIKMSYSKGLSEGLGLVREVLLNDADIDTLVSTTGLRSFLSQLKTLVNNKGTS